MLGVFRWVSVKGLPECSGLGFGRFWVVICVCSNELSVLQGLQGERRHSVCVGCMYIYLYN